MGDWEGEVKPALSVGCWGRGMSLISATLCSSCVSPGGTGGPKLAQLPELASAEMSLHAIYLHQVSKEVQKDVGRKQLPNIEAEERGKGVSDRGWGGGFTALCAQPRAWASCCEQEGVLISFSSI